MHPLGFSLCLGPVFQAQALNLRKLSSIVCNQDYIQPVSVTPDKRVEWSNRLPPTRQRGAHFPVTHRGMIIERGYLEC